MSRDQVGVLYTKRRTYIACARDVPDAEERLARWEVRLNKAKAQPEKLEDFIGRERFYVLSRRHGDQANFSFERPILSLTRGHILGLETTTERVHAPLVR